MGDILSKRGSLEWKSRISTSLKGKGNLKIKALLDIMLPYLIVKKVRAEQALLAIKQRESCDL